ncbi:hypothetical protein HS088_TW12G01044 [Tripterygium wilfordii]|uniref:Transcription factor RAX3 n=1 Tax=Tripterygium wilfordii TaxID=458696 RepID=A0A7J7D0H9_TRIWF|nr:transcription factor RAX3-like [Tripterygium wilfordii]KAF5739833.1 hypothetical protein HS088_TW12G01044 [Tripterygium wilfordii]
MGRAPCCDKSNVKRGPWSPEEDAKLKSYIEEHGTGGNWIALPQKIGLKRCGKSCRLRWLNYLRPNIKHGGFSEEEDNIICSLYISIGSRWSIIAAQLPGRTDNDIKNYWNTRLKKKLLGKQRKEQHAARSRGEAGLKQQQQQDMIKRSNNIGSNGSIDTNNPPYWPEVPVMAPILPYEQQQFDDKDHASIRKLLIKLGGRFSDDHDDDQVLIHEGKNFPFPSFDHQQFLEQQSIVLNAMPSTASMEVMNGNQFVQNHQYRAFPVGIEEEDMVFSNNNQQQNLEGLEFLYSENNNRIESSAGWGEMMMMSSLVFPPAMASNGVELPPQMLEEGGSSDQLRYSSDL